MIQQLRKFLGWRIVGICALMEFISAGFFFYSFAVFTPYISTDLGIPVQYMGVGMSVYIGMNSLTSPFAGKLLDRLPINLLMSLGALGFGLSLLIISLMDNQWMMLVAIGMSGFCASFIGMLAPAKLISNWFIRKRGLANGLCNLGISGSGVIIPPIAAILIGIISWNYTIMIYSAICIFIAAPIAYFFIITSPSQIDQQPDNAKPISNIDSNNSNNQQQSIIEGRLSTNQILTQPIFWLMAIFFSCMFTCIPTTFSFIGSFLKHAGFQDLTPWLLSITALFAMIGKVFFGYISDKIQPIVPLSGLPIFTALGFILYMYASSPALVFLASICFGFGFGGIITMNNFLYAKIFGLSMGSAMGLGRLTGTPFQILGPIISGIAIATYDSYQLIFIVLTGIAGLAFLSVIGIHVLIQPEKTPSK